MPGALLTLALFASLAAGSGTVAERQLAAKFVAALAQDSAAALALLAAGDDFERRELLDRQPVLDRRAVIAMVGDEAVACVDSPSCKDVQRETLQRYWDAVGFALAISAGDSVAESAALRAMSR